MQIQNLEERGRSHGLVRGFGSLGGILRDKKARYAFETVNQNPIELVTQIKMSGP